MNQLGPTELYLVDCTVQSDWASRIVPSRGTFPVSGEPYAYITNSLSKLFLTTGPHVS